MALPLDLFVLITTLGYVVVGWIVGVRLLGLARRSGGFPETALGIGEVLLAGIVPPVFIVAGVVQQPEALIRGASVVGHLAYVVGSIVMVLFTWWVFRRDASWAGILAVSATAAVRTAESGTTARNERVSISRPPIQQATRPAPTIHPP